MVSLLRLWTPNQGSRASTLDPSSKPMVNIPLSLHTYTRVTWSEKNCSHEYGICNEAIDWIHVQNGEEILPMN